MGYLTFRRMLAYLVASIFIASVAVADSDSLVVSPITAAPTGDIHNGKVVWLDLVTTNPKKAVEFYSTVFGWQSQSFADGDYVELSHRGQVICAVASFEDGQAEEGDARWLISISGRVERRSNTGAGSRPARPGPLLGDRRFPGRGIDAIARNRR